MEVFDGKASSIHSSMNSAEKALAERLSLALTTRGFRWQKAREMFVRKESHGFFSLLWTSHPTHDDGGRLELTPVLGVRHDVVESVVDELGLVQGDDNKRYTTTVTQGLGYFPLREGADYKQYIRLASIEADIEHAASKLTSMLYGEGVAFFERYASLLECSRGLNFPVESTERGQVLNLEFE